FIRSGKPRQPFVDRFVKVLPSSFFQGKEANRCNSVLMEGKHGVSIRDAARAFVVEEPPLAHFSLERANRVRTTQCGLQWFLNLKCPCERCERVNCINLIGERSKAVAKDLLKEPGKPCVTEDSALALVVLKQVVGIHHDVCQIRKPSGTR